MAKKAGSTGKKAAAKKNTKASPKKAAAKKASGKPAKKTGKKKEDLMCFLSSACVFHHGLPDDCRELRTLRTFRDQHLMKDEAGRLLVSEYYSTAPKIVAKMNLRGDKGKAYTYILREIRKCCSQIRSRRPALAVGTYSRMFLRLKSQYL